ncbi:MAG: tRNA(Ile)-lysidine synthetase [Xanthomonadaceae bacterium]|nr:tRNA(Ile)-lysidine synthetase [Xanthomonadaceae bacterium]
MLALPVIPAQGTGSRLLVGFSGGLDSSVLLHLLAASARERPDHVSALHVHHGLHAEADAWAEHCQRVCDGLGIALSVERVEFDPHTGDGLEAAARKARHAAFERTLEVNDTFVLAHHRDDQAETFLLRALRASGPDGLGAMRPWRAFGRGWLWRPLLETPRSHLLEYARQHRLDWVEDASNANVAMDRNFLRHRILPLLRERWPHADAALARSAALSAQASALLADEDAVALAAVTGSDPHLLQVPQLLSLDEARRSRVLRHWIASLGLPPIPAQGIAHIACDLLEADTGKASFAWSGAVVRRWRSLLHAAYARTPRPEALHCWWDGREPLPLPDGGLLQLDGASGFDAPLHVRGRIGGERMVLPGRGHSHALKHLLQQHAIPPWQRSRLPLLFDAGGTLLAAGDSIVSAKLDAWLRDRNARLHHIAGAD